MSCEGRIVCLGCGMHTWVKDFGCTLPGCDNYVVVVKKRVFDALDQLDGTTASSVGLLAGLTPTELDELGGVED